MAMTQTELELAFSVAWGGAKTLPDLRRAMHDAGICVCEEAVVAAMVEDLAATVMHCEGLLKALEVAKAVAIAPRGQGGSMMDEHQREEYENVRSNQPLWPGDTIADSTIQWLAEHGYVKRDTSGYWVLTEKAP